MNIYYLASCKIPSSAADSLQVMKMCDAFNQFNNELTLFASYSNDNTSNIFDYYGLKTNFSIIRKRRPKIKSLGAYLFSRKVVSEIKKRVLPDIFYGRDFLSLYLFSKFGVPIVFESHMIPLNYYHKKVIGKLLNSNNFRYIIVTANQLKEEYTKIYPWFNPENIIVAFNGANFLNANKKIILKGDSSKYKIGYVGGLMPGKGIELIKSLATKIPYVEFHIIGGNYKDLQYWKKEMKSSNVFFYGFVQNADIGSYYEAFDILIAPYLDERIYMKSHSVSKYPSPLKLIEYMSAKKPIIASDLPMSREVLKNNHNSVLCSVYKLDDWYNAINTIINDKHLSDKIRCNAFDEFVNNYTWQKRAEKVLNQIDN